MMLHATSNIIHHAVACAAFCMQVYLNQVTRQGCVARIACKLELNQPCRSVKDRIAYSMIQRAEDEGIINPATTTLVGIGTGDACTEQFDSHALICKGAAV